MNSVGSTSPNTTTTSTVQPHTGGTASLPEAEQPSTSQEEFYLHHQVIQNQPIGQDLSK